MNKLSTTADVIDKLGGTDAVAARFRVSTKAVNHWRYSREFPTHTYLAMKVELARIDCDADLALWKFTNLEQAAAQ